MTDNSPRKFTIPPPIKGDWLTLPDAATLLLLSRLRETGYFDEDSMPGYPVRVLPLEFYPGWVLCDFLTSGRRKATANHDEGDPPNAVGNAAHSFLYGADGFTALDGKSSPIHEHNSLHGISIDTDTALESYFRFFCFFIRGNSGPFEVVEKDHHFVLPPNEKGTRKKARIAPPKIVHRVSGEQTAKISATIFYDRKLFASKFVVGTTTGNISMEEDEVIASDVTRVPPLSFVNTLRFQAGG